MNGLEAAHKRWWEISEVVFGIPFLLSLGVQWLVPLLLPEGILRQALIPIGSALIVIGLAFIILARREFASYGQSMEPGHPIGKIVDTGVFSISRNPLYLGIAITVAGIAFVTNWVWVLVLLIPAIVLCYSVLIAPEERYLLRRFGEEYLSYTSSVRRWFGRK